MFSVAWREGRDLDLPAVIQGVQTPPFDTIGVFELETFYPAQERLELAMALNHLVAWPGFAVWLEGEPLDVQRLLFTEHGKPRIAIISIAHLNDAERMFIVTLLLGGVLAWMRRQSGASSLRALLYMDEIFGYFPPTAMPPSKQPLLTLMKQARAFGVGVVLATQNPMDLDYKGCRTQARGSSVACKPSATRRAWSRVCWARASRATVSIARSSRHCSRT